MRVPLRASDSGFWGDWGSGFGEIGAQGVWFRKDPLIPNTPNALNPKP